MNFDLWTQKIFGGYGEVFAGSSCLVKAGRPKKSKAHLDHWDVPLSERTPCGAGRELAPATKILSLVELGETK